MIFLGIVMVASDIQATVPSRSKSDPYLACLAWMARFHGFSYSQSLALRGLPSTEGQPLDSALLGRAAANCGLTTSRAELRPSTVPAVVAPFIAELHGGQVCVVRKLDRRKGMAEVVFPADAVGASTETSDISRRISFADLDRDATGRVFYVAPVLSAGSARDGSARSAPPGHWLWQPVRQMWPAWLMVLVAACVINLLGLATPVFVMQVYDRVLPNQTIPTLWALTAGVTVAIVFDLLLRQLRAAVLDHAGRMVDVKVAGHLFQRIMAVSMNERRQPVGGVANQIREFETVRDFFTSSSVIAATDVVFIGLIIAVTWIIAGPLAWAIIIAVPVVILLTLATLIPLGRSVRETLAHASRRHSVLVESLTAIETLKSVNGEGVMQRRWEEAVGATARANTATRYWSSLAMHLSMVVQQAVSIIIVVWGVYLVSDGTLSVGGLIAASMLAGRALAPLANIAMTVTRAQQAFAALRGLNALMDLKVEDQPGAGSTEKITHAKIDLKGVTFRYPDQANAALDDVSLSIRPGERVAIVGRVGSGKSTLGRLMARLYAPQAGQILIGGLDIQSVDSGDVRTTVGFVPQDIELFAGTLRDNLTLGARAASDAEIETAIALTGVDQFVASHPLGLGMQLRERGQGLSGGQRQAVGLARALLRQPKVLFLDEPSSAMDTGTEAELVRRLASWCDPTRVLIVCTHRLHLLELCDRLIVIEGGRIAADGPKAEVLSKLRIAAPVQAVPAPVSPPVSPPVVAAHDARLA
jgi:ATP-binding cassette, subfamily C, bacterial LapB